MAIVRQSKKRDALLALLRNTDTHPSADQVYQALKPGYPGLKIGRAHV